jgi:sialic acid synthase SpsE
MNYTLLVNGCQYNSKNPLVIAELGTSHNGSLVKAKEMVSAAESAGANCVKLQMVFADEILHPNTGEVLLPGGKTRLYDRFKELEKPPEFYAELKEYIESKGLLFLCTPFGPKSAQILHSLQPKIVKIASPELNFTGLLDDVAQWGVPVLLSSGVSTLGDIETALHTVKKESKNVCLLHCITAYPAPESEYNLRILGSLSRIFGVPAGVSDHSLNPLLVPVLALTQGAAVIEKHFCLSRDDPGLDDPIALPPESFSRMTAALRQAASDGPEKTLAALRQEWGDALPEQTLGSGVKELAPSERDNYLRTRRSIHALQDIQAGEIIQAGDFSVLRTEKLLRPGLEPCWAPFLPGRTARSFIPAGEGIRFEDV